MNERLYPAAVDAEGILDLILTALNDIVEFELAVILKLGDDRTLWVRRAMGPLDTEQLRTFRIDLRSRSDIAQILERPEPYLFAEGEAHEDTYHGVLDLPDGHSCLVAPLHLQGTPIGMLTLDHRACNMFSANVVRFIGTLAKLISIIVAQSDSSQYLLSRQRALTEERNLLLAHDAEAFLNVVGSSRAWLRVLDGVGTVAGSDLPVLIQGETGTGKEQIARSIHRLSARADARFVALNCSVLNAGLAESELFGHEKGAFTSAVSLRRGRFELASGGTLFLDEIGDLPAEVQPKLLRALQEGSFERVGGERTIRADVRVIAASNVNLRGAVERGTFREDLYYRLSVFPIELPPLRNRGDDVVLLAEHFLSIVRADAGYEGVRLSAAAIGCLLDYRWPGNVRELQNVIRRSALIAGGGVIEPEHLRLRSSEGAAAGDAGAGTDASAKSATPAGRAATPADSAARGPAGADGTRAGGDGAPATEGADRLPGAPDAAGVVSLDEAIRRHIRFALSASGGRIYGEGGAAAILGLKPSTLQSRMKKLGIDRAGRAE